MLPLALSFLLVAAGGPSMVLKSDAFAPGAAIPALHTCDGTNLAPPLSWSGVPEGTRSLALIVDDPDAPGGTWVHWIAYNLPPSTSSLPVGGTFPAGARQGVNGWKQADYSGPCPPSGQHRYSHRLYALDTVLPDLGRPTKPQLELVMKGHILAQAELIGTYQRKP